MKQALALSALAVLGAASVAPAMAGPYLTTKVGAKGEGSDFDKSYIETRVGYETKYGKPEAIYRNWSCMGKQGW